MDRKLNIDDIKLMLEREDNYYDFKEEYPTNNKELLKDILSLANCNHDGDRYLLFGIAEEDKFTVKGIENTKNRKKLVDIQSCLDSKFFACERVPSIDLYTVKDEDEHEIDVLEIKNKKFKPYFLIKDYENVKSHKIYTRHHDQNNEANSHEIIHMWKEQFGLTGDVKQKFNKLLTDVDKWQYNEDNHTFINLAFPENKIVIEKLDECSSKDAFMLNYGPHKAIKCNAKFLVNDTEIEAYEYVLLDEYRNEFPTPHFQDVLYIEDEICGFYYYIENSSKYLLFELCEYNNLTVNIVDDVFPHIVFKNKEDFENFNKYLENEKENLTDTLNNKQNDCLKNTKDYNQNINVDALSKFVELYQYKFKN